MNIRVDDDVEMAALSAALASQGLALVWRDGRPTVSKTPGTGKLSCPCGSPASVLIEGRAFCSSCYLGGWK
jgi:hypothetical protein